MLGPWSVSTAVRVRGEGSSIGRRNGGRGVLCNENQPKPYAVANFGRTLGELAGTLGKVLLALGDVDEIGQSLFPAKTGVWLL